MGGGHIDHGPSRRCVRVLVFGEVSGAVALASRLAVADVATRDLTPTERTDIPHCQGEASRIMDLGWDLVITHPPCIYLANSGVNWLYRESHRWEHLIANADTFRRMYHARAAFVAVENSKMHR